MALLTTITLALVLRPLPSGEKLLIKGTSLGRNEAEKNVTWVCSYGLLYIKLLFDVKEVTQMEKASKESVDTRLNESDDDEDYNTNNKEAKPEVLEKDDIFFFYRPKTK